MKDVTLAKRMKDHPGRSYWLTRASTGVGAELRDLRATIDDVAFGVEHGSLPQLLSTDIGTSLSVGAGATGVKLFVPGFVEGYEKAARSWTYTTGKQLIITAIKPGELGNRTKIVFYSKADGDSVTCDGNVIKIGIHSDGNTTPSELQTLVAADRKISQLIVITSTDNSPIPDSFASAGPWGYLAGGTGLGWGGYLSSTWESNTGMLAKGRSRV